MSNIKRRPDCRMRSANGNCCPMGGFCTSNSMELCEAMQRAYWTGHNDSTIEIMLNRNRKCEKCKHWESDTGFCYEIADSDTHKCHFEPI